MTSVARTGRQISLPSEQAHAKVLIHVENVDVYAKDLPGTRAVDYSQNVQVRELLTLFEVSPVDRGELVQELDLGFTDFEDAVLHEAARDYRAAAIVTRDAADFVHATLPILDPRELLAAVAAAAG